LPATARRSRERVPIEAIVERLGPQLSKALVIEQLRAIDEIDETEATRIAIAELLAALERDPDVRVREKAVARRREDQATAHAEVDEEDGLLDVDRSLRLAGSPSITPELDEEILRATPDRANGATREDSPEPLGVDRNAKPRLVDSHAFDAPPDDERRERAPETLDLG